MSESGYKDRILLRPDRAKGTLADGSLVLVPTGRCQQLLCPGGALNTSLGVVVGKLCVEALDTLEPALLRSQRVGERDRALDGPPAREAFAAAVVHVGRAAI